MKKVCTTYKIYTHTLSKHLSANLSIKLKNLNLMLNLGHTELAQFVLRDPLGIAGILLVSEVECAYQRVLLKVLVVLPIEMLDLGDRTKGDRTHMNMIHN